MNKGSIFISYGRSDMKPIHWVDRLKLYFAPMRRKDPVQIWDDSMIGVGRNYRKEIKAALDQATFAILFVGPAFLKSKFIRQHELPPLIQGAEGGRVKLYPLVVRHCRYKQSILEPYEAFNDPKEPLDTLKPRTRNKILNKLCVAVDREFRRARRAKAARPSPAAKTKKAMNDIAWYLQTTKTAFDAQSDLRDDLVESIEDRLKVRERLEYEKFFIRYFKRLNREEEFQFNRIRATTKGLLHDRNAKVLSLIESHPDVLKAVPSLTALRQHLVFWLNKYDEVFLKTPEMCVLYTGVEDGVPFPRNAERHVSKWIKEHR